METESLLMIFVRNPEKGKVKTRLAKSVGDQKAFDIYIKMLQHIKNITKNIPFDKAIFYSEFIDKGDLWTDENYSKFLQNGDGIGERMNNAFIKSFSLNYKKVIIIGSDIPDLTEKDIIDAFEGLDKSDCVIGPSKDGGYYLLGMKALYTSLFENKQWSTNSVLNDTMNDFEKLGLNFHIMPVLTDIDEIEEMKNLNIPD